MASNLNPKDILTALKTTLTASPSLAPDGKRLFYLTNVTGTSQVWMIDLPAGAPKQITNYEDNVGFVRFSPKGDALVFGNIRDAQSSVSQTRQSDRAYVMLKYLNTQPRVSYLARIKNPNSRMPDASRVGMANGAPHGHGAEETGVNEHEAEEHGPGDRHETEEPTHH